MFKSKCLNVFDIGIAIVILVFFVSVLSGIASAQRNITECTTITDRGVYVLTENLTSEGTCIEITTSDVIFDGDGHALKNSYTGTYGVIISNSTLSISNVTIKNLIVNQYHYGIYLDSISDSNLSGNTVENLNYGYGIYLNNSHNINLSSNTANSSYYGIYLLSSSNNSISSNNASSNIGNTEGIGIYLSNSNDNNLNSNTANDNSDEYGGGHGIFLSNSDRNNLNSNNASKNGLHGIFLSGSNDNNLDSNIANENSGYNGGYGIYMILSNGNNLSSNTANYNESTGDGGGRYGIYLDSSNNNKLNSNIANSNIDAIITSGNSNLMTFPPDNNYIISVNGITLQNSTMNTLSNNVASSNADGISLDYSNNNILRNNNIYNNFQGVLLHSSSHNNLSYNNVTLNSNIGILLSNSSDNNINNDNYLLNNNYVFISNSDSLNNEIQDININHTIISFIGKDVAIKGVENTPTDPPGGVQHNIEKYINVTNMSADSWIFLNVSYDHADLSNLNESTLLMWEYDGSSWSLVSGINDVNKEQNYVYANITSFSIFAPMGIDNIPPAITITSPQNITYPMAVIPLNVSADQEVGNWLYSLNGGNNTSFMPNATIVASKGANTLIVYANDTAGNWNSSTLNFSVDLSSPVNITILSPENNSINKTGDINVTVSLDTLVDTVILNWDGVNESNLMESIPNDEGKILYKGNKTGLFSGNFSFRVYARDMNGNFNVSETRIVDVDRSTIFDFSDYIENGTIIKDLVIPALDDIPNVSSLIIFNNTKITFNCTNNTNTLRRNKLQKLDSSISSLIDYSFGGDNITFEPICDPKIPDPQTRFIPDAQIRFNYTHEQLRNLNIEDRENELTVQYYNISTKKWEDVEPEMIISRDTVLNIITVNTSHLTVFALAVPAVAIGSVESSGGGGSVGGAGVVTKEPFENIEKFEIETKDINDYSSSTYRYTFQYGIYEIIVNGKNVIDDVSIRVELLKGLSKLVKEPAPEVVHFYQNIWSGTKDVKDVIIRFKEDNSWINSQNISNVKMLRWDGSKWIPLETKEINKDDTYTYFEVRSEGFSNFAVIGEKAAITQEQISPASNITLEETAPGISQTGTNAPGPAVSWNYILIVLALILGLIIVVLGVSGAKPIKSVSSEQFVVTSQEAYGGKYYEYLLEQYKLYVITADKIRERQQYTNNYFLIFNSIFVAIFGVLYGFASMTRQHMWQYLVLFAGFLVSITWGTFSSRSRQSNSVRLALIHEIESKLPMELHYSENKIMEENKGNPYLNYSLLEQYMPWIFTGIYILLMVMVLSGLL